MIWSIRDDAPIYAQLIEQMKLVIVSGEWPPGGRVPPVRELAAEAGVNPNTMQRAMQELEREELVFSRRTSGRFVTEERETISAVRDRLAAERIRGFLDAMARLGYSRDEIIGLLKSSQREEKGNADT